MLKLHTISGFLDGQGNGRLQYATSAPPEGVALKICPMTQGRIRLLFLAFVVLALVAGCERKPESEDRTGGPSPRPLGDVLTLTVVPYEAAERLQDEYTPMAEYLAQKLECRSGRFVSVVDYAGVLAALETGDVDVAYLSPFPYVLATSRMSNKPIPLAMPWVKGSLLYKGIIFVRADSDIRSLEDLRGKTFAFGDVTSTTGYLLPRALLEQRGIFSTLKWRNAGNANMVVKAVENKAADAGAAYENVFEVVYREEPEKAKLMRVIAETPAIPNGVYVARGDLPSDTIAKLKEAFLAMNTDPVGRAAMLKAPNDKIVPPDDKLFEPVRETARILKLDVKSLEKK